MTNSKARTSKIAVFTRLSVSRWLLALLVSVTVLGMVASDEGQLESAIAEQRARIALDTNATDLNDLANLLVVRGDLNEAEDAYRQALDLAPESIEIPYNLALLLQHREKNGEALKLFRRVVKKAPDAAWAHLQIGIISSDLGKRRQALAAFSTAFSLEPRLASPKINPHLQDRPEVLEAMLRSSKLAKNTQTAPLSFSEPDRIARLLVGESAAARAAQRSIERRGLVEGSTAVATVAPESAASGVTRRLDVESLPESAQTESARPPRSLQTAEEATQVTPVRATEDGTGSRARAKARAERAEEAPSRRVVGVDDLREVRGAGVTGVSSPAPSSRAPAAARPGRSRQATPVSAAPRNGRASGGSTSRFRPGSRSSARLELRLAPPSTPTVAASRLTPISG